jgi:hypothetical protein
MTHEEMLEEAARREKQREFEERYGDALEEIAAEEGDK